MTVWRAASIAAALLALVVVGALVAGEVLTRPARRVVGAPPDHLPAESVTIPAESGGPVHGWFAAGAPGRGAVVLLHGVRGDRRDMLGRGRALLQAGFSVLLIDLPGHGESEGERITFGRHEARGVAAALNYMARRLPAERIGVIGVSLGAAALVYSRPAGALGAVVLESMYPTISEAVENRLAMRFGGFGRHLAPLLLCQLRLRLGVTPDDMRPIDAIPMLRVPLLIVSGSRDEHTTLAQTRRLYEAAREPKELWVVDGAAHVDLHRFDAAIYEARVIPFMARRLGQGAWIP
jgi:uncharacterized protein